jgi:cytochrome b involved in lipid metabolism
LTLPCAVLQDATDEFNAIHSAKAKAMLKEYLIGRVGEAKAVQAKLPGIKEDEVSFSQSHAYIYGDRR